MAKTKPIPAPKPPAEPAKNLDYRYVNDLRRIDYIQSQTGKTIGRLLPFGLALAGIGLAALATNGFGFLQPQMALLTVTLIFGCYMALNIGANDVSNNMGPAVGASVITVPIAIAIAVICEVSGALLAGGDVTKTIAFEIMPNSGALPAKAFQYVMLSALLASALWINFATWMNSPVSTTHTIIGGVMGAGFVAAGLSGFNWPLLTIIALSWIFAPIMGGIIAALMLYVIKNRVIYVEDRKAAAQHYLPILFGILAAAFTAYMSLKAINNMIALPNWLIWILSLTAGGIIWRLAKPWVASRLLFANNDKTHIYAIFNIPLIISVGLLSFAHGANDIGNAVGPIAAILSASGAEDLGQAALALPLWVMLVGALGLALGVALFSAKLISTVGRKITRLNAPRAFCVALSSALTVLLASGLALPVSSTHIALGAVFGVGFLREYTENPNRHIRRPAHKLNVTAQQAFMSDRAQRKRQLVRRRFLLSIVTAWIVTVPVAAALSSIIYVLLMQI